MRGGARGREKLRAVPGGGPAGRRRRVSSGAVRRCAACVFSRMRARRGPARDPPDAVCPAAESGPTHVCRCSAEGGLDGSRTCRARHVELRPTTARLGRSGCRAARDAAGFATACPAEDASSRAPNLGPRIPARRGRGSLSPRRPAAAGVRLRAGSGGDARSVWHGCHVASSGISPGRGRGRAAGTAARSERNALAPGDARVAALEVTRARHTSGLAQRACA